jgi:hypothetical protein
MITIETLENYKQTEIELSKVCAEWAKQKLEDWQHYCGFKIYNKYIAINYSFNDIVNNIEYETVYNCISVPFDNFVEFAKTLEL